ncbi:MAG TPA: hypothetical protein DC054_03145 [Blastocatellia bacterium]|nr:hypothetical protein [Blastocatellia bacterium]
MSCQKALAVRQAASIYQSCAMKVQRILKMDRHKEAPKVGIPRAISLWLSSHLQPEAKRLMRWHCHSDARQNSTTIKQAQKKRYL